MVAALLAGVLALPINATCMDADADTIAISQTTSAGWVVKTSTAGGPWERTLGPFPGPSCPSLAAAEDGTAILMVDVGYADSLYAIRRPGGRFGPATPLHQGEEAAVVLAAARGGTVGLLRASWHETYGELFAEVMPPDGAATTTRVARFRRGNLKDFALAPDGTGSVLWNEGQPLRKRYAELDGGRWSAPVDLSAPRTTWFDDSVALAQAPSGRRLLAWEDRQRLLVSEAGAPTKVVARPLVYRSYIEVDYEQLSEPDAVERIDSALADDGSAVIVYRTRFGLFVVGRRADEPWSQPNRLAGIDPEVADYGLGAEVEVEPGGRAVALWPLEDGRVVAVSGQAGGKWGEPAAISAPSVQQPSAEAPQVPRPSLANGRIVWVREGRRRRDGLRPGTLEVRYAGTAHSDALTAWISSRMSRIPTVTSQPG